MIYTIMIPEPKNRAIRSRIVPTLMNSRFDLIIEGRGSVECVVTNVVIEDRMVAITAQSIESTN